MKKITLLVLCIIIFATAKVGAQISDTAKNMLFDSQVGKNANVEPPLSHFCLTP